MIGTCIALGLWTSGLLYMTVRAEKRRLILSGETPDAKKAGLQATNTERMDEKV